MQARRKPFRVESMDRAAGRVNLHSYGHHHAHDEIMSELRSLRALVKPSEQVTQQMIEAYKAQIAEAAKLKHELDLIQDAIIRTKQEIATVHVTGFEGPEMARVTNELDAIVGGTESATDAILSNAEEIDQLASTLAPRLKDEQNQQLVQDMQERVIKIFEACNFQDLTGQRISKVMNTMKFIEQHINAMMDIWGGVDAIKAHATPIIDTREGDAKLLNGPKLDGDVGHASQDDIDALFD
jgi:chemotaxis protein CheZ